MKTMKTVNLGGFSQLQATFDHIYLLIANGEKFNTVNSLITRLRKDKYKIDAEALRAATKLGYINPKPYFQWLAVGPLTEHHIKILMYETFMLRARNHHSYRNVEKAYFGSTVPNCKYQEADKEVLRLKRIVAGLPESSVREKLDAIKETSMFPKAVETLVNCDSVVKVPDVRTAESPSVIKVVLSSTGVTVSSDNVMLELKGKFTLEYSN